MQGLQGKPIVAAVPQIYLCANINPFIAFLEQVYCTSFSLENFAEMYQGLTRTWLVSKLCSLTKVSLTGYKRS